MRESRLKPWKTKPSFWFRRSASWFRLNLPMSTPSSQYLPLVGRSRQPIVFIIVLFPDPLAPMMATNSPGSMARDTLRTAMTSTSPVR